MGGKCKKRGGLLHHSPLQRERERERERERVGEKRESKRESRRKERKPFYPPTRRQEKQSSVNGDLWSIQEPSEDFLRDCSHVWVTFHVPIIQEKVLVYFLM